MEHFTLLHVNLLLILFKIFRNKTLSLQYQFAADLVIAYKGFML